MPAPLDRPAADATRPPLVRTDGDRRTLEFTPGDVQSEMLVSRPDALVLEYTRAMMCFALFCLPPDDARLRILHCDAADYLARMPASCDVLLVDGFDSQGLPPALADGAFYAACRRALHPGGVLVANVFTYDPQYAGVLQRLRAIFDGRLAWFSRIAGNNRILFAVRPGHPGAAPGRGERLLTRMACKEGRGLGWSNRLLARLLVAWLARRRT